MEDQLGDIMKQYTSHLASQVNLKLPELKKFKKPNKTKIKLPKLSKVGA